MIKIQEEPINTSQLLENVTTTQSGAVVLFLGNTREFTGEQQTTFLSYECYEEMAISKMKELSQKAMQRWELLKIAIIHRTGKVDPGETSVAIAVASEHRQPAFEAGKWLIDTLKEEVPIWKKEKYADGSDEWVHPQS